MVSAAATPLVSVIMPTHNRASLLGRAMASVLAQTYRNLELFVVDDASSDRTPEVVRSFTDPRLHYIRLDKNRRAAAARNIGIKASSGPLVAFLDDDDFWLIQKLERQVAAMAAAPEDVGLNLCAHITMSSVDTRYIGGPGKFGDLDFSRGFGWQYGLIATPGWLARRRYLEQVGLFDEGMRAWDDWELAIRLSDVCKFSHLDEPLFIQDRFREVAGGMWDNKAVFANDMRIVMNKHHARWAAEARIVSTHYVVIGRGELLHDPAEGRRWLRRAVVADRSNYRALVFLWLSWLGPGAVDAAVKLVERLRTLKLRMRRLFK